MLLQSFAVLADHVVQTQVQLVKGEGLLCVGSGFSRRVVVGLLRKRESPGVSRYGNRRQVLKSELKDMDLTS